LIELYFKFGFTEIQTAVYTRKSQTCQNTSMYSALYSVGSPIQSRETTHIKCFLGMDVYIIIESKTDLLRVCNSSRVWPE